MRIAFAGSFAARLAETVRMRLSVPCEVITDDEESIISRLGSVDVLISMCFTKAMADAGARLKLIQVPGAGLDRIGHCFREAHGDEHIDAAQPRDDAHLVIRNHLGWT